MQVICYTSNWLGVEGSGFWWVFLGKNVSQVKDLFPKGEGWLRSEHWRIPSSTSACAGHCHTSSRLCRALLETGTYSPSATGKDTGGSKVTRGKVMVSVRRG